MEIVAQEKYLPSHKEVVQSIFESPKISITFPEKSADFSDMAKFLNSPEFDDVVEHVLSVLKEGMQKSIEKESKRVNPKNFHLVFVKKLPIILKTLAERAKTSKYLKE